jgi:hypothetical protein
MLNGLVLCLTHLLLDLFEISLLGTLLVTQKTLCINGSRNFVNGFKRSHLRVLRKGKIKFLLKQAIKAQRAVKGTDSLCLFLALDEMGRLNNATLRPLCLDGKETQYWF